MAPITLIKYYSYVSFRGLSHRLSAALKYSLAESLIMILWRRTLGSSDPSVGVSRRYVPREIRWRHFFSVSSTAHFRLKPALIPLAMFKIIQDFTSGAHHGVLKYILHSEVILTLVVSKYYHCQSPHSFPHCTTRWAETTHDWVQNDTKLCQK